MLFVATPALLKAFGISPSALNPHADVLTVRAQLPSSGASRWSAARTSARRRTPRARPGLCIQNPVIQEVEQAAGRRPPCRTPSSPRARSGRWARRAVPVGWLIQAPTALTAVQVNAARQAALGLGATIETKSGQLSLGEISNGATIGGLLLALGVLAMTVGLIRSETTGDLRTLTAAGAGARTRRALTGVTAGVLAFLGAALGTVAGLPRGARVGARQPDETFGNVPWTDIGLLVIGMPLIGARRRVAARRPPAVRRRPASPWSNPGDNSKKRPACADSGAGASARDAPDAEIPAAGRRRTVTDASDTNATGHRRRDATTGITARSGHAGRRREGWA